MLEAREGDAVLFKGSRGVAVENAQPPQPGREPGGPNIGFPAWFSLDTSDPSPSTASWPFLAGSGAEFIWTAGEQLFFGNTSAAVLSAWKASAILIAS